MSSMYKSFETDPTVEEVGVWIEYETFRVRVARSGGKNKRYTRLLAKRMKPYRRAVETDTMSEKVANTILREVFAEAGITEWQSLVGEEWVDGLETPDTPMEPEERTKEDLAEVTFENVDKALQDLPDLFHDLRQQSNRLALYRRDVQETESGN